VDGDADAAVDAGFELVGISSGSYFLQCFDAVGWAVGRVSGL